MRLRSINIGPVETFDLDLISGRSLHAVGPVMQGRLPAPTLDMASKKIPGNLAGDPADDVVARAVHGHVRVQGAAAASFADNACIVTPVTGFFRKF